MPLTVFLAKVYDRDNRDADREKEQIEKIDDAFERSLDLRFEGGAAHELERCRAALTKHAFKVDDRALAKAELEIVRQDQTRKLNEAEKNHKHERPEATALERAADYAWRTPQQLQAHYVNPRLLGLDWIDENGRDKGATKRKR